MLRHSAGGHTSTAAVRSTPLESVASAPSSHGASSFGMTPGAHAAKALKRLTSMYRESPAAARSVSAGGVSALSSSFTCVS